MVWTSPMTAVAGSVFTAAQFNANVRDNLNQTAPALASAAGQIFVATAVNAIAARVPSTASVATLETTASTSYTDLTTPGPSVTVTTGTQALVIIFGQFRHSASDTSLASYAVSGASTISGSDNRSAGGPFGTVGASVAGAWLEQGLTAGSNTFKVVYRTGSGTGTFINRKLIVIPLS